MEWRDLEFKQKDKTDHRLAFLISTLTSDFRMVAESNGAKVRGGSVNTEKLYIPWGKAQGSLMDQEAAKGLFNTIKALAGK